MTNPLLPAWPVLVVDDDEFNLRYLRILLEHLGVHDSLSCDDSREVLGLLGRQRVSLILLDLMMPHLSGESLLMELRQHYPGIPVVVVTSTDEVTTAVRCIKLGAFDYVVKPLEAERLAGVISNALSLHTLNMEDPDRDQDIPHEAFLVGALGDPRPFRDIITISHKMLLVFQYLLSIAPSAESVLVTGETGVGKELLVRVIHSLSKRSGPFVALNVAGVDDPMFTDTLFGHARGAFTSAGQERRGLVEQAQEGTLLLDEIGDLSAVSQAKLLRLLQDGDYLPLGHDRVRHTSARMISATNRDLWDLVKSGAFREDLNFRLRTHHVHIPPLRERREDIPLLIRHFLRQAAIALKREPPTVPDTLMEVLAHYPFPGNIRELRSMIINALSLSRGSTLSVQAVRQHLTQTRHLSTTREDNLAGGGAFLDPRAPLPTLREANEMLLREALRRASGNQKLAGQMLGISQQAVSKRLKSLEQPDADDPGAGPGSGPRTRRHQGS